MTKRHPKRIAAQSVLWWRRFSTVERGSDSRCNCFSGFEETKARTSATKWAVQKAFGRNNFGKLTGARVTNSTKIPIRKNPENSNNLNSLITNYVAMHRYVSFEYIYLNWQRTVWGAQLTQPARSLVSPALRIDQILALCPGQLTL